MKIRLVLGGLALAGAAAAALLLMGRPAVSGQEGQALNVVLIPADGGTEDGTRADYQPIFDAVERTTGLEFNLTVAQSYATVIEALCGGRADIAFVGPVPYVQARQRDCAELLAVAVEGDASTYYAGLFVRAGSDIRSIEDLKGRRAAFGDVNSTSSFLIPMDMLMKAGLDPATDFSQLRLAGSHTSSLAALLSDQVDVAALSFDSFDKAVAQGAARPTDVRIIARSEPIPYPPLVMRSGLSPALKSQLKAAFAGIADAPGVRPEMIRGYGGKQVDGYRSDVAEAVFDPVAATMARQTDEMKGEILQVASRR
ncbi:Phosphate-import protein PhnD precursor [compost metagenome]